MQIRCSSQQTGLTGACGSHCALAPPQLMGGAAEARHNLSKLATDVSSWWTNLDPTPKAPDTPKTGGAGAPESKARSRTITSRRGCSMLGL